MAVLESRAVFVVAMKWGVLKAAVENDSTRVIRNTNTMHNLIEVDLVDVDSTNLHKLLPFSS